MKNSTWEFQSRTRGESFGERGPASRRLLRPCSPPSTVPGPFLAFSLEHCSESLCREGQSIFASGEAEAQVKEFPSSPSAMMGSWGPRASARGAVSPGWVDHAWPCLSLGQSPQLHLSFSFSGVASMPCMGDCGEGTQKVVSGNLMCVQRRALATLGPGAGVLSLSTTLLSQQ